MGYAKAPYWRYHLKTELTNKKPETRKISCLFCASRCGIVLHILDGRIVKVEGDLENPVSRGWTCSKGRAVVVDRIKSLPNT